MADLSNPFSIRLTKRQAADLDSLVQYDGLSRQELIRRAVDMYLEDRRKSLLAQVNAQRSQLPLGTAAALAAVQPPAAPAAPAAPAGVPAPEAVKPAAVKIARR